MPTSTRQDRDFGEKLSKLFSDAIQRSVESEFEDASYDWVLDWVGGNFEPSDVFSDKDLAAWAEANGYALA